MKDNVCAPLGSILTLALGVLVAPAAAPARALDLPSGAAIAGDYLEARSAEVVVGHCLANAEVGLVGREAILAWTVRAGEWRGEPLAGLSVVAVVQSEETLGDVAAEPVPARAVVVVDERASPAQRDALLGLARSMAGSLLTDVVRVEAAPIEVTAGAGSRAVRAGELAALVVRDRRHDDGLCGNEAAYYPPLVELEHAHPTYTLVHEWRGTGLEGTWKSPEKSSSYAGTFAAAADAEPVLEPADALPGALPETLAAVLATPGHRVNLDGRTLAELWLRRSSPPTGGIYEGALGVEFGALAASAFVGLVRFPETWIDYRDTELPAGVYTLRYWVQPTDGDHMGVSQYRDFLLLCPAAEDTDPDAVFEEKPLLELSQRASGRVHPAVIALFPIHDPPTAGAELVRNDLDQLTLAVASGDLTFGFVLEGHGDLP